MNIALINALASGLSIWKHKEARRYLDKTLKLRRRWLEAYNVDNNGLMDAIGFELCGIAEIFHSTVGTTYITDK